MVRKNVHIKDDLALAIGDIRHEARYKSETEAIERLLDGATSILSDKFGYVYLVRGAETELLKIGFSTEPSQRFANLERETRQGIEPVFFLYGQQLLEMVAHIAWGRYRVRGEWFRDVPEIRDWFENHEMAVTAEDALAKKIEKRSVLKWSDDQYEQLQAAAEKLGLSVPAYCKVAALEKSNG